MPGRAGSSRQTMRTWSVTTEMYCRRAIKCVRLARRRTADGTGCSERRASVHALGEHCRFVVVPGAVVSRFVPGHRASNRLTRSSATWPAGAGHRGVVSRRVSTRHRAVSVIRRRVSASYAEFQP
jgi:hypothetical protein